MSINETINIQTTSINAIAPTTGVLSVGNSQTTGVLNLGTGVRTAAGVVNIATTASNACAINIMNGATTAGSVNIANGTGATQTTAVNIGSGTTTGTVTIGNSANTVQVNGALAMGASQNIKLQSSFVSPGSTTTLLGGTKSATTLLTTPVNGSVIGTITITDPGVYLFIFSFYVAYSALGNTNYVVLSGTGLVSTRVGITNSQTSSSIGFAGSQVGVATASDYTLTLSTNSTFTAAINGPFFKATRIA